MCCDFRPEEDYRADTCIHDDYGLTGKRGVAMARIELLCNFSFPGGLLSPTFENLHYYC